MSLQRLERRHVYSWSMLPFVNLFAEHGLGKLQTPLLKTTTKAEEILKKLLFSQHSKGKKTNKP